MVLDADEVDEGIKEAALGLTCIPLTTVTQLGVKFVLRGLTSLCGPISLELCGTKLEIYVCGASTSRYYPGMISF
jgi:hypothetical protein